MVLIIYEVIFFFFNLNLVTMHIHIVDNVPKSKHFNFSRQTFIHILQTFLLF